MGVPFDSGASLLLIGSVGHALRAVEDARARGGRRDPRQEFRRWYCGLPPRQVSPGRGPLAPPPTKKWLIPALEAALNALLLSCISHWITALFRERTAFTPPF